MEKVRPWCGQPSDRGRLKNRTEPGSACTRKVKPIWILLKQETASGSGTSWATCKSAPRSRQITTLAPHLSDRNEIRCRMTYGRMLARRRHSPANVACQAVLALPCWSGAPRPPPSVPYRVRQTWNWVIGSPGQWVIWVIFHVRVTESPGHHFDLV